jgi:hypothetical protein
MRIVVFAFIAACLWPYTAAAQTPYLGTPAVIPGTIEAENFDEGGQGVAYNDSNLGNMHGEYRTTDVDIDTSPGAPGSYVVENFATGEWMTYSVEVAATAWYDIKVRLANQDAPSKFHIEVDGVNVTGAVAVPFTGDWEIYQWIVAKTRVPLTAGPHRLRIVSDEQWAGLDAFDITTSPVGTPFSGTPATLPGIIQAENFNEGGQGVAYYDTTSGNTFNEYRTGEDVDIDTSPGAPGGYVVENFDVGEWRTYTVEVQSTAQYDIKVRVASQIDTSTFHIEVDGVNVTGAVAVPNTGDWDAYQWFVAKTAVPLSAGTRHLAIVSGEPWFGMDAIEVVTNPLTPFSGTPAAVPGIIELENFDNGGPGFAYQDTNPENMHNEYRPDEGVDIDTSPGAPGGYVVENFATGEWMAYTINVQSEGMYDFEVRLASQIATSTFHIEIDGNDVTGPVALPNTGDWDDYQWHTARTNVHLHAGIHVLKIVSDQEWAGLDKLEIKPSGPMVNPPSLLFRSGYEAAAALGPPRNCDNTKCLQDILGTDSSTGFGWPPNLFGGNNRFDMRSGTTPPPEPGTIGNYMFNEIRPNEGRNNSSGLYMQLHQRPQAAGVYDAYLFYPNSEVQQLYVSYWVKFQPDLAQKLHAGDAWRVIFEWKTAGDYRVNFMVMAHNNTTPRWVVKADNNANGGLPIQEFWRIDNSGVPVPINQWFKLEVFWHRSSGGDGRVWAAINGRKIVDRFGPLMGVNNAPINRMFFNNLYTGGALPAYQWIDDMQIWSTFPTAVPGDPWYDPPYGQH